MKISLFRTAVVCFFIAFIGTCEIGNAAEVNNFYHIPLKGAVDQTFQVDFKGDGQNYWVFVTGDMMAGYTLRIVRGNETETLFPIRAGIGELMMPAIREDGKQDVAYIVNNGSGYYIQDFNIIGYDGHAVTTLVNTPALKTEGVKQGRLKLLENKLYLFFAKAETGYCGPESKRPIKQYMFPVVWETAVNRYIVGEVSEAGE